MTAADSQWRRRSAGSSAAVAATAPSVAGGGLLVACWRQRQKSCRAQAAPPPAPKMRGRRRCAARLTRAALLQEGYRRRSHPKGSRCRSASCVIADKPVVRCRLRSQEGDLRQVLNKKLCVRACYARHTLICPHTQRDPPRSRAAAVGPLSLKRTVEDQVVAEAVRGRTLIPRT